MKGIVRGGGVRMDRRDGVLFWNNPLLKWLALGLAFLKTVSLLVDVGEFRRIRELAMRAEFFGSSEWEILVAKVYSGFALDVVLLALYLVVFFVGFLVHREKTKKLAMGIALIIFGLLWGGIGFCKPILMQQGMTFSWGFALVAAWGGGLYLLWKSRQ